MSNYLTRDAIFAADDRTYEDVPCPEWSPDPKQPLSVRLRSISGAERDTFEQGLIQQRGNNRQVNMRNARAKLIVLCAVDEGGAKLFTEDDVRGLGRKNAKPLDRLFDACQRLAGLSEDDVDKLTEDFDETQGDDSTTA